MPAHLHLTATSSHRRFEWEFLLWSSTTVEPGVTGIRWVAPKQLPPTSRPMNLWTFLAGMPDPLIPPKELPHAQPIWAIELLSVAELCP
jgi:hypothetical protein